VRPSNAWLNAATRTGAGRWISSIPNIFRWRWRPLSAAQAVGIHYEPSEFCGGTTTQRD